MPQPCDGCVEATLQPEDEKEMISGRGMEAVGSEWLQRQAMNMIKRKEGLIHKMRLEEHYCPVWLRDGLSEWAFGRVDCEGWGAHRLRGAHWS